MCFGHLQLVVKQAIRLGIKSVNIGDFYVQP